MKNLFLSLVILIALSCNQSTESVIHEGSPIASANWIAAKPEKENFDTTYAAPYFRKEFQIQKEIKSAKAQVTGVGYFEFYLNGKKVDNHVLDPAVTRFDKTVKFLEFDVSEYINEGKNVAGGIVGNGFYNLHTKSAWDFNKAPWRNIPAFICAIEIISDDGSKEIIITDQSWKHSTGPITFDQIRNGEYYDARLELIGWNRIEFDDMTWQQVTVIGGPSGKLEKQIMPAIKKTKTLKPIKISEPKQGVFLVDFGQNIAGWAQLKMKESTGSEIIMRYGERIFDDGTLDQKELSRFVWTGETQTTRYICKGKAVEAYEPRFVYFGFQYVQIEGLSNIPKVEDIEAYMVNTAFDTVGYFECSNELINQIHENIQWSYLGNYHSFPEDCPHREKMGWTGDAQLVVETGLFNFDAKLAYKKWMQDFSDEQQPSGDLPGIIPTSGWGYTHGKDPETNLHGYGPHWEGAVVTIPWQVYRWTGDTSVIEEAYPSMLNYLGHLENISENYLLNFGIDDHKSIRTHTDGAYISSAYFHWLTSLLENMALVIDEYEDARHLDELQSKIFSAFNEKYFDADKFIYGNSGQTSLALALNCGLVPERYYNKVLEILITNIQNQAYHFDAGVVGVKHVIDVLLSNNRKDVLYMMANKRDFPSFGHWIELGANTMWQNWDGSQSRNHIMFGSIGDYFYKGLAGINPVDTMPGFTVINLSPQFPADMDYLICNHKTPNGWLKTEWKREGERIVYTVQVPKNSKVYFSSVDRSIQNREFESGIHKFYLE